MSRTTESQRTANIRRHTSRKVEGRCIVHTELERKGREGKRKGMGKEDDRCHPVWPLLTLCFLAFLAFHQFVIVGFPIDSQMVVSCLITVTVLSMYCTGVKNNRGMIQCGMVRPSQTTVLIDSFSFFFIFFLGLLLLPLSLSFSLSIAFRRPSPCNYLTFSLRCKVNASNPSRPKKEKEVALFWWVLLFVSF